MAGPLMMDEQQIRQKLEEMRSEHRDLDAVIEVLTSSPVYDQLRLQRLKKRKLAVKDMIIRLEAMLIPDIIA
jgi:hypothetical protein